MAYSPSLGIRMSDWQLLPPAVQKQMLQDQKRAMRSAHQAELQDIASALKRVEAQLSQRVPVEQFSADVLARLDRIRGKLQRKKKKSVRFHPSI